MTSPGDMPSGDTVADFHLWSLSGEEYILSNEVEADKPTILFNGSVTCIRFQNDWNPALTPIAYEWVYSHLDDFNWVRYTPGSPRPRHRELSLQLSGPAHCRAARTVCPAPHLSGPT